MNPISMVVFPHFVSASDAKQSILSLCGELDCFASLAMTGKNFGRLFGRGSALSNFLTPVVCLLVQRVPRSFTAQCGRYGVGALQSRLRVMRNSGCGNPHQPGASLPPLC
jgi:hypothetical protein